MMALDALRPCNRLQQPKIPYTRWASEMLQQGAVHFQCFVAAEKGNGLMLQAAFPVLRFRSPNARGG